MRATSSYENRVAEVRALRKERAVLRQTLAEILASPKVQKAVGDDMLRQAAERLIALNEKLDDLDGVASAIGKAFESNRQGAPALRDVMFQKRDVTKASDVSARDREVEENLRAIKARRGQGRGVVNL